MSERICLIVDDQPLIRDLLKRILEREGFKTLEAETALQAFKIVEELRESLDLIVTDILMPGDMNGVDLAHAVRNAFPTTQVIVMSGFVPPIAVRSLSDFEFMSKPFNVDSFLSALRRVTATAQTA